jgi:2-haloacid dehalogenase
MIRALVFDAYGTLFDPLSVRTRCDQLWPGKGEALAQLWRTKQLEYTWLRSLMRRYVPFSQVTREALEFSCSALSLPLKPEHLETLMAEYRKLALYPDVMSAMKKFKPRKCAILSNGSPDMLDPLVAQSGLKFDAVLSVDAVRIFKPAPEVYALAVEKLGTPKEEIGFVSSNGWDALGAKSFGFRVYWINRTQAPIDRLGFEVDNIVKSLDEVLS